MGGWSTPRPGRFTAGKDPVPIVQEAGWDPGLVWTGAENFTHTGIRSPDRSARSESLYRLSYPRPRLILVVKHETEQVIMRVAVCLFHLAPVFVSRVVLGLNYRTN